MAIEELAEFNGAGAVPEGRVDPPLYVGIKGKVYDVSYGGFDMYKPGTTYNIFAGKVRGRGGWRSYFLRLLLPPAASCCLLLPPAASCGSCASCCLLLVLR